MSDSSEPEAILDSAPADETPRQERRRFGRLARVLGAFLVIMLFALAIVWSQRERIADNVIEGELRSRGIPATYKIERIAGRNQILRDIVVGDPARPDLTAERAQVEILYRLGLPRIGRITLTKPRLFGTLKGGKLSFGTLDPLLFGGPKKAFALPDIDIALIDGRALLDSDYGRLGFKAEGQGNLSDGFKGILAVAAPRVAGAGCTAEGASYFGKLAVAARRPSFTGPLRVAALDCPDKGLSLRTAALQLDATLSEDLRNAEGTGRLASGPVVLGTNRMSSLAADTHLAWRDGALTAKIDGRAGGVATSAVGFASLATEGTLRTRDGFSQIQYEGSLDGAGVRPGRGLDASLAGVQRGLEGTLLAPLLAKMRGALVRHTPGSRLTADVDYRQTGSLYTLVVPQAALRGGSGATLAALSRLSLSGGRAGAPRLAGNFSTGGPDMPQIAGRMERSPQGRSVLRLTMAEYRAGNAALALPQMAFAQARDGSLGFAGIARASGPLPGGFVRNLAMPIDGGLAANGELAVMRRCTTATFDQLTLASLSLDRRSLTLCPQRGGAIVRNGRGGLRIAAGAPSLDLAGRLGATPIRIASGPVGFAYPGVMTARRVDVALGPAATASRFSLSNLEARLAPGTVEGRFDGTDVRLAATPLDVTDATGRWRYAGGRLAISDATLKVSDRNAEPRFAPLVARGATLTLFANRIDADALLREPATDRAVVRAAIHHDLATASGHADLFVDGITFDRSLQPADLSRLALGTIANANGTVRGGGRIDWNARGTTSSGDFSTDKLDFAAAFGPVTGMSGTVHFTDLLGLVTAPDQEVRIATINPGIEVTDGVVRFSLAPGSVLKLQSATWPFLGGTLTLAPTNLALGVSETRRYVLLIEGLDAARFVERMGLANISATGTFDGKLPLVFASASGESVGAALGTVLGIGTPEGQQAAASTPGSGRIEGGLLTSRPPGGNVSYVGELTYRDLSTMANFAFQTLKSLDYKQMTIQMDGALEGEIVTRVKFDGVRQGAGTKRNFLTRAVADLPIQFNVNIRAPFYQLITSLKALYDPAFVKDPRTLGLIDAEGRPIAQPTPQPSQTPAIQPPASENVP
ncbi:YdbH domain-containing protein [Novosphingobium tardum]|uniref:YdbH domain-containing protein n=1 Tax=Novosphingobium tardum TaxID=1538021 RepID=A0ABV8RR80_9SPHN